MSSIELGKLTAEQHRRILRISHELAEVYTNSEEEWLEGFRLDLFSEREISIWETLALAFSSFTNSQNSNLPAKKEAFKILALKIACEPDERVRQVQNMGTLTGTFRGH
jgi:hypothetical protein